MIQIGRNYRYRNLYHDEVRFSQDHGFECLQLWFDKFGLCQNKLEKGNLTLINDNDHPVIIHALVDIDEFQTLPDELLPILDQLNQRELIIHPVCKSQTIETETVNTMVDLINQTERVLTTEGVQVYIENNSQLTPIFYSVEDLKLLFDSNDNLKFLLDIAHIGDYEHLGEMIDIKYPEMLHLADRNLENKHEHLPVGEGNIDFELVFHKYLRDFRGRIIFELMYSDEEVATSKKRIEEILSRTSNNL